MCPISHIFELYCIYNGSHINYTNRSKLISILYCLWSKCTLMLYWFLHPFTSTRAILWLNTPLRFKQHWCLDHCFFLRFKCKVKINLWAPSRGFSSSSSSSFSLKMVLVGLCHSYVPFQPNTSNLGYMLKSLVGLPTAKVNTLPYCFQGRHWEAERDLGWLRLADPSTVSHGLPTTISFSLSSVLSPFHTGNVAFFQVLLAPPQLLPYIQPVDHSVYTWCSQIKCSESHILSLQRLICTAHFEVV